MGEIFSVYVLISRNQYLIGALLGFDLGRDLVPVVKEFHSSKEKETNTPSDASVVQHPPFAIDGNTNVPDPFSLQEWLDKHESQLKNG